MPIFTQKKCPTCGGRLENISGNKYECRCCHNMYEMNEGNTSLYDSLQTASTFRESLNFKQAEMLYKNMLKKYANEDLSDVYWNLLLCEQRVMFETDQNGEQFPSFYDIVQTEIDESEYYSKAIEYAQEYDTNKLMCFVDLANKMQEAKNKYRTIKSTTKPYDIFICFKKSSLADPTKLTKDYQLAYDLYNHLSASYKVFFSERSLDNIVIREYEPNIYHALYTAKIMLVLCSDIDYLNSQWVRNEWSRFKMMTRTSAQAKSIIPIFIDEFSPDSLPDELRSCQGYNNDIYLMQKLGSAIKAIINPVDMQAELAASLKAEMEAKMQEQMAVQMEAFKKQLASASQQDYTSAARQSIASNSPTYLSADKTKIENFAFLDNKDLTSFDIPKGVTHIGVEAFQGCMNLRSITIPNGTTKIDNHAFRNCIRLIKIDLPSSVAEIGECAFYGCSGLRSISLPKGIKAIKQGTFYGCTSLKTITIPKTITEINNLAFDGCENPLQIVFQGTKSQWDSIKKSCDISNIRVQFAQNFIVPYGTTVIASEQLKDRKDLTNAIIPDSVWSIGSQAFAFCSHLSSIVIPDSVTSLGNSAFFNCSELKTVKLSSKLTVIWDNTFSYCGRLEKINIPDSVTKIGGGAFSCCHGLTDITLPQNVTSIEHDAFIGCDNLVRITIPKSVTEIGSQAFKDCRKLTSIKYTGTMNQWKAIPKGGFWNSLTPKYTVYCTDGNIKKSLFSS